MMKKLLLSILILLTIQSKNKSQEITEMQFQAIEKHIQLSMDIFDLPGLAVAITKNNKLVYHKAFGVKNIDTKDSLTCENIFHFASDSKPFVATAIMQLVEQNKVSLDDKLTKYIPYFKIDDERYKDITIKQVLNHTSGLGNVDDYEWDKAQYDVNASEKYVKSLTKEKLSFAPGTDWAYSNLAFDIMGDVIAKISGMPFETYIKENIFKPLEMENSSFIYPEIPENLRTTPHIWTGNVEVSKVYPYNRIHAPSSTLNSSVLEMSNWAIANLNKGQYKNSKILDKESYDELWTNSVGNKRRKTGLSWFLGEYRGMKTIYHGGGDPGFTSFFIMLPDSNLSLIVATNYMFCPIDDIAFGVLDAVFGHEPKRLKLLIGIPLVAIFQKDGIKAANDFYETIQKDSTKRANYIYSERGFKYLTHFANDLGLSEEELFLYEYNVKLHPNSEDAHNRLGEMFMKLNQFEKAISSFKKSIEIDPENEFANKKLKELIGLKNK